MASKEDFLNKRSEFTMESLRRFVENNKDLSDDAPILIQRVEDRYFEGHGGKSNGWNVLKVEGYHYFDALRHNEKMNDEVEWRKNGNKPTFPFENPLEAVISDENLETLKEQFYSGHCISTDKEIIYIYSHY